MCSKMDFLTESEQIQEELSKFKDGISKGLQLVQTRETCIEEILEKMREKVDPIYQNQMLLQEFLTQVATKIPMGGPDVVHLFQLEVFNDFGEQP